MTTYFRLIRFYNLLFIAFIQIVMQKVILVPLMQIYGIETSLSNSMLSLLVAVTILIAAGGYILNDYFDIKIDTINRPEKQIVGKIISRQKSMLLHQIFTGIGVFCGLLLAYLAHSYILAFIFIVVPGLLWFYSASYKRQFIIGNLIVAFIAGLTVLIVGITQLAFLQKEYSNFIFETPIPGKFYGWIGGFALFSFLTTWIREVIKDMEDEKGDRELECHTMPIVWGQKKTKLFLYCLILITVASLLLADSFFINFEGILTTKYILLGLVFPFAVLSYLIYIAKSPTAFHQASTVSKSIMLIGVLYSFVLYYLQAKTYGISLFNLFIVK